MVSICAVAGIIQRDSKLLVSLRPDGKPYGGFWEFPGGKIEVNENSKHALSRELHEELGIEMKGSQHLFNHTYSYPDKIVQLEIWLVTQFSGEPHSKENQELRWVTLIEMAKLPLLEGNKQIVDRIKQMTI